MASSAWIVNQNLSHVPSVVVALLRVMALSRRLPSMFRGVAFVLHGDMYYLKTHVNVLTRCDAAVATSVCILSHTGSTCPHIMYMQLCRFPYTL